MSSWRYHYSLESQYLILLSGVFQVQLFFLSVDYLSWWPGLLGLEYKQLRAVTDETGTPADARMVFRDSFHVNLNL